MVRYFEYSDEAVAHLKAKDAKLARAMFERYRRRYSPYGSVASLYLWAISHMDVPGYDRDFAPKAKPPR